MMRTNFTRVEHVYISFYSRFKENGYINNKPEAFTLAWLDFVEFIQGLPTDESCIINTVDRTTLKKDKEYAPYICATTFNNDGKRVKANVEKSSIVWLDCDDITKQDYIELRDKILPTLKLECILYTTASHTEDKPKFRLIFPLNAHINAVDYYYVWKRYCELFKHLKFDESKKSAECVMFLPVGIKFSQDGQTYTPTVIHYEGGVRNALGMVAVGRTLAASEREVIKQTYNPVVNIATATNELHPYIKKVFENQFEELRKAGKGRRNITAFKVAGYIAGFEKTGSLPVDHTYWWELETVCRQIGGFSNNDIKHIIEYPKDNAKPRSIPVNLEFEKKKKERETLKILNDKLSRKYK